ncbi:helix-turn-helix domain-containing protein [Corynebacterium terpenotabidum]|uniref:Helix-turn-helix domain-containing protein n=1 Tax=Corynebacterium terpenotabidum Y-11 TaxID=1200352 RepID=S4XAM9_9CORY|nr:helix-turn-helix domain-containing protein [Corynebacterium terpenotabidum]AGP29686.1 hypothetical protein A606_00140 [Corynebacterium terpenotabidum Y-11]
MTDLDSLSGIDLGGRAVLNQKDAAQFLGVSVDTIRHRTNDGTLDCYRLGACGKERLYRVSDLLAALVLIPTAGTIAAGR